MKLKIFCFFYVFSLSYSACAWTFSIYNWTDKTVNLRFHRTAEIFKAEVEVKPVEEKKGPTIYKSGGYCLSKVTVSGDYQKTTVANPYMWGAKCANYEVHIWHRVATKDFNFTTGADPKKVCPIGQAKQGRHINTYNDIKMPHVLKYDVEFR